ncbi:uncharacterized protein LOC121779844 [Salvia splendens]|uniref:uncharacterized protein LOC121779844 n=1 Tax=Salvia splendens TaxID=180675 RepID=UPI001C25878C|nr:uncharacterized protein LOC121779844 [Salvia splendens]
MRPDDDWYVREAAIECLAEMERGREAAEQQVQEKQIQRPIRCRTFVRREHDLAHQRLFADYFTEEPRWGPTVFHNRFRMRRDLFLSIVQTLEARDPYFQYWEDGIGRPRLTPLQKCTVVSGSWRMAPRRTCLTSTFMSGRHLAASA